MPGIRIGVDIGGTFTDLVYFDEEKGYLKYFKVPTTPFDPVKCFFEAIDNIGVDYGLFESIIHATTLGTNLFLGQMGLSIPKALLLTNKGFRDVLEIGRQNRPELYNVFFEKPVPLIPRRYRLEVSGRIDASGNVLEDIDVDEVASIVEKYCSEVDVFIVVFLHSYVNPIHEERVREIIMEKCPDKIVVTSHEVDPRPGEYERTSTTVLNALLKPMLSHYLTRIYRELVGKGFNGKLLVMKSDGGLAGVEQAVDTPVAFIESGPAAGAVAVAYVSRVLGIDRAIGFDMGGTTAKASAIVNGVPEIVSIYEVGGKIHMGRLLKGSGYPVRYPYIDLAEVSAGGGSIAWIDEGGALRVGPLSAGADPGPACYGRGGVEPTITDANLLLGRLPEKLAGGRLVLDKEFAYKAVARISDQLGLDIVETCTSIIEIADTITARALRLVSIERGHDPRDFVLFAFGGAGPLHAVDLGEELGVREIVVPMYPGVFSAYGLLVADYHHTFISSIVEKTSGLSDEVIGEKLRILEEKAYNVLRGEGVREENIRFTRFLGIRYWGQAYELEVPYNGDLGESIEMFHDMHRNRYGYSMEDEDVEVLYVKLDATGFVEKPLFSIKNTGREARPNGYREVFFREDWVKTPIYDRLKLGSGSVIEGPAVIESIDSTILVPPDYIARVDEYGLIWIRRG